MLFFFVKHMVWEAYGLVQPWVQHYTLWPGQTINFPVRETEYLNATEICCNAGGFEFLWIAIWIDCVYTWS